MYTHEQFVANCAQMGTPYEYADKMCILPENTYVDDTQPIVDAAVAALTEPRNTAPKKRAPRSKNAKDST